MRRITIMKFAGAAQLQVAARSDGMVWNAVAVDGRRVFVAGPRWPVALYTLQLQGEDQ